MSIPARLAALLLLALFALAPTRADDTDSVLDAARLKVESIQQALKNGDGLSDAQIQRLRSDALATQASATEIAGRLAPDLAGLDARAAELGTPAAGTKEDPDVTAQRAALAKSRSALDGQLKLARLLAVEGDQLAAQAWALRRSQFQARLGERTDSILAGPFWNELSDDLPRDTQRLAALGAELDTAARKTPPAAWIAIPLALAALAWALRRLQRRAWRWLETGAPPGRLRRSLHALAAVVRWTATAGALALALHALLDWNGGLAAPNQMLLTQLVGMLWFCGFLYGLTNALICARRPSWRLPPLPDTVAAALRWFPLQLTLATLVSWLAERLAVLVNASLSMTVAVNCVVALALGLVVVRALMRGERLWRVELAKESARPRPIALAIVAGLNWLVLAAAVVCLLAGYVAFGSFAIKQVVWAGIVLAATYLLCALVDDALMAWLGHHHQAETAGAAAPRPAKFAVLASGVLRLSLVLFAMMLLLMPFGEGPADLLRRSGQWGEGLAIGEFKLQPGAVLQALLVLLLGLGAVRVLRAWLADHYLPTTALDAGMQSSATSLFGYAGVVVAVSFAMSAMGVGLERIAWVASALSVGIGFGLQAVVQNFVSGLILLAERPVKVGDWVSLGGVEGDIRRINVRATEIQMGDHSTVIVPNSEFITKTVRNITMANSLGLVQIKLPMPLDTDVERVRSLMLEAFQAHADVLDTPAPSVALDGIDAIGITFNATGFVASPRLSYNVRSTLLFEVLTRL
ncbi:MAG TPA: DUF3772 domain-containing protein, partial [Burkholderiaceae bacterium]|nr:DUF3772 domain-containing protein [Burkholderiaceae bacterium]